MFTTTFSGSSRRPRQVNLSGQNTNPFARAGTPGGTGPASGTQQAIAAAQRERQLRQQERERNNAIRTIQRVWRGHQVRLGLASSRRDVWDRETGVPLSEQLTKLLSFFSSQRKDDGRRLEKVAVQINHDTSFLSGGDVQFQLPRLANIALQTLQGTPQIERTTPAGLNTMRTLLG